MQEMVEQAPRSDWIEGRQAMQTPEEVQAMLKLASLGWGAKRISRELGCSRNTVRNYLRQDGWHPYQCLRAAIGYQTICRVTRKNLTSTACDHGHKQASRLFVPGECPDRK